MSAGWARGAAPSGWSCSGCGRRPHHPDAPGRLRADLSVLWLIAERGRLRERRFCRPCAPDLLGDVACSYCGDGPLLGGDPAGVEGGLEVAVAGWLAAHTWLREPARRCPRCVRAFGGGPPR